MTITDAFILVIPALLLLLGVGAFAAQIERAAYYLHGTEDAPAQPGGRSAADIARLHQERSRDLAKVRDRVSELDDRIADLQRERANLLGQEQALVDVSANFVAEVGFPSAGAQGQFIKLEGKSKEMPFAGLASVATALSGRRRVRLVVWGMGPAEAQNFAMTWAGDDARMIAMRPFEGTLFWHEA